MEDRRTTSLNAPRQYVLKLFVAGDAANSRIAKENLQRLRERVAQGEFKIEVVDVEQDPQEALEQGIYVTPALQVIEPAPGMLIFGNLSDLDILRTLFPQEV